MHLTSPWWLLSLVPVALLIAAYVHRVRQPSGFAEPDQLAQLATRSPAWRRHATFGLLAIALVSVGFGLSGPTAKVTASTQRSTVMLAIDVSQSMQADDITPTRLHAAEIAAQQFAAALPKDLNLGLVAFSGSASVLVPPTTDRRQFDTAVNSLTVGNSTALGDAVISCLNTITAFGKDNPVPGNAPVPAQIVLMSDGASNAGTPVQNADAAAKTAKVPVSTIAFGTSSGTVTIDGATVAVPVDASNLQQIATATGGTFQAATSGSSLGAAFAKVGSQIAHSRQQRDISWRFLLAGVVLGLLAIAASMARGGRLA